MPGFTPPQFLRALLNRAYFPTELPPVVNAKYFSEFCRDNYASLRTDLGNFLRLTHPLSQLGLSLAIPQKRGRIRQIISSKPHSVYSPDENPSEGRAFAGLDFRRREIEAARIGSQCEFVLRADISRFFYTAYTHSFQWAVLGRLGRRRCSQPTERPFEIIGQRRSIWLCNLASLARRSESRLDRTRRG